MKRMLWMASFLALALAVPAFARAAPGTDRMSEAQLREAMRRLWEDHVTYTAFLYTAVIHGGDDAGKLAERLLRNQDDIGNAVKPFYGDAAGAKLSGLLRDHILVAAELVKAAKAGDAAAQEVATRRWYANASEIATFLAAANPAWPRPVLVEMLNGHLALTIEAVGAKLHGDTAGAISAFDRGNEHMLALADTLSSGIVKQFPGRFSR